MTYKELKSELKKLGCWKQFKINIKDKTQIGKFVFKEHRKGYKAMEGTAQMFIYDAFILGLSPEGYNFWEDIINKLDRR